MWFQWVVTARLILASLQGFLGLAMDSGDAKPHLLPPAHVGTKLACRVQYWEAEIRELSDLVQEARTAHAKLRSARNAEQADGWAGTAKAEAAVLGAEATLREREAEAALAQVDLHFEQWVLYSRRRAAPGPGGKVRQRALCQRCWALEEKAAGTALLAFQNARALTAQARVREAMAAAMERVTASGHGVAHAGRQKAAKDLRAALAACDQVLVPLAKASATVGVHRDFLVIQEADWHRLMAALTGQIEAL